MLLLQGIMHRTHFPSSRSPQSSSQLFGDNTTLEVGPIVLSMVPFYIQSIGQFLAHLVLVSSKMTRSCTDMNFGTSKLKIKRKRNARVLPDPDTNARQQEAKQANYDLIWLFPKWLLHKTRTQSALQMGAVDRCLWGALC